MYDGTDSSGRQWINLDNYDDGSRVKFDLVRGDRMDLVAPQWIIKPYLEAGTLSVIFGDFASGKSFFAIDQALCIASGHPFHGAPIKKPGAVIYLAGEGFGGLARRREAWSRETGVSCADVPIFFSRAPAAFLDGPEMVSVYEAIHAISVAHDGIAAIFVDTLQRNFGAGDENSTSDMTAFVAACDGLRERFSCAVVVVHHTGHMDKQRSRGSIVLPASADSTCRVEKSDDVIKITYQKMKDGEVPPPSAYELKSIDLGLVDDDGIAITSAVLVPTEMPEDETKDPPLGKQQSIAMNILRQLLVIHSHNKSSSGYSPETSRVTLRDWGTGCAEAGLTKQRFYKVKNSLLQRGEIQLSGDFVTIIE